MSNAQKYASSRNLGIEMRISAKKESFLTVSLLPLCGVQRHTENSFAHCTCCRRVECSLQYGALSSSCKQLHLSTCESSVPLSPLCNIKNGAVTMNDQSYILSHTYALSHAMITINDHVPWTLPFELCMCVCVRVRVTLWESVLRCIS